jgi:hypothetical protein
MHNNYQQHIGMRCSSGHLGYSVFNMSFRASLRFYGNNVHEVTVYSGSQQATKAADSEY